MSTFIRVFLSTALLSVCTLVVSDFSIAKPKPSSTFEYNGPLILFEDVFQNPDDNDLKLNYARQQAALGDFLSAAFVLEGMLFETPNWDTARLFYAIMLAELDDHDAALYEFSILEKRPLSDEHRAISTAYLKKLNKN